MKIGFYGTRGAYSEAAAAAVFKEDIATYPNTSMPALFDDLEAGKIDLAVMPYSSSRVGMIPENMHFMRDRDISINYQIQIPTAFALAGAQSASENDVTTIYADPLALLYCSEYVQAKPELTLTPTFNMTQTLEKLSKDQNPHEATLCSNFAASIFGLKVHKPNCNDMPNAFMVYAGFAKEPRLPGAETSEGSPITMLVMDLADEPGSLMHSLEAFQTEDINLLSMELRPTDRRQGRVSFFVTFEGLYTDENVAAVQRKLESVTSYVRCLGSYVPQVVE